MCPSSPSAPLASPAFQATQARPGAPGSGAGVALNGGSSLGHPAGGTDGRSRGLWGYGGCDASPAGGDEGGIGLGVGSGVCTEGDGKEGGRRGIGLVDSLTKTCRNKREM